MVKSEKYDDKSYIYIGILVTNICIDHDVVS